MKIFTAAIEETTEHITVRLNGAEYNALRSFMHTADKMVIMFPFNVSVQVRGRGWYRLVASTKFRLQEKLTSALRILRAFAREEQAKQREAQQRMMPIAKSAVPMKVVAYCNGHYTYASAQTQPSLQNSPPVPSKVIPQNPPPVPSKATPQQLLALANHFNRV